MVSGMSFHQLKDSLWTVFNYLKEDDDVVTFNTVLETGKALNLTMNENAIKNGFKIFKKEKVTFEEFQNVIPH
jgi:hypothetical protein